MPSSSCSSSSALQSPVRVREERSLRGKWGGCQSDGEVGLAAVTFPPDASALAAARKKLTLKEVHAREVVDDAVAVRARVLRRVRAVLAPRRQAREAQVHAGAAAVARRRRRGAGRRVALYALDADREDLALRRGEQRPGYTGTHSRGLGRGNRRGGGCSRAHSPCRRRTAGRQGFVGDLLGEYYLKPCCALRESQIERLPQRSSLQDCQIQQK